MTSVFSPVMEMKAEEYKRVTEVTYLRGLCMALFPLLEDEAARPREDCASWISACISQHPITIRLLCGEACNCRFYRFSSLRAYP